MADMPPLPTGFTLDKQGEVPPLPVGFTLDKPAEKLSFLDTAYNNPLVGGAETALHIGTGIPNLVSQAFGGPDLQYEPRSASGKLASAAVDYLPKKYSELIDTMAMARAEGPIGGKTSPYALAKLGLNVPVNETPDQSRQVAAALALAGNAAPILLGLKAKGAEVKSLPLKNTPSGLLDLIRGDVPSIAGNYIRSISGNPATRTELADALVEQKSGIPHYQPNAAQKVSAIPAGTPIQALQQQIASSPAQLPNGGPAVSQAFARQISEQAGARSAFLELRDKVTSGMREKAIEGANANAGIPNMVDSLMQTIGLKTKPLITKISTLRNTPGFRASDVITKTLGFIGEKLASLTDNNGVIDANDLYTVRMDMGKYIEDAAGAPGAKYDRKLAAGLQDQLQSAFDDAIEAAGGTGWKSYLHTYSRLSKAEQTALESEQMQYKPAQATNLSNVSSVTGDLQTHIPHLLTRSATGVNWIASLLRKGIEPKVQGQLGEWLLNPQSGKLAAQLRSGIQPQDMMMANAKRQALIRALSSATIGGALQEQQ